MKLLALFFGATLADGPEPPPIRVEVEAPLVHPAVSVRTGRNFAAIPSVKFVSTQSGDACEVRLYDDEGRVDEAAVDEVSRTLSDARKAGAHESHPLDPRLLQVVVKTALHFGVREITVVSGYRKPGRYTEGNHAHGKAIDFALPGVERKELASYLRTQARLGVGEYVHKRTQYVHVDVRDDSYHWIDGTPPGRPGWGARLSLEGLPARDAAWTPDADLPE